MAEDRDTEFERLRAVPFEALRADSELQQGNGSRLEAEPSRAQEAREGEVPTLIAAPVFYERRSPVLRFWLDHPFRREDGLIRSVDLVPPTYADVLASVAGFKRHTEIFAAMSGLSEAEIAALRWSDSERLIKLCHALMPDLAGV